MGLSVELEKTMVSGLLNASSMSLLPRNFQIIPYDHLYERFHANVPPLVMVAVPKVLAASDGVARGTKLGIFVSNSSGKDFHNFASMHWRELSQYTLLVTEETAMTLDTFGDELKSLQGVELQWDLQVFSNSRMLANILAGANREDVGRMLLFLDPNDIENEMDRTVVLREAAAQHGQELNINQEAQLWLESLRGVAP